MAATSRPLRGFKGVSHRPHDDDLPAKMVGSVMAPHLDNVDGKPNAAGAMTIPRWENFSPCSPLSMIPFSVSWAHSSHLSSLVDLVWLRRYMRRSKNCTPRWGMQRHSSTFVITRGSWRFFLACRSCRYFFHVWAVILPHVTDLRTC